MKLRNTYTLIVGVIVFLIYILFTTSQTSAAGWNFCCKNGADVENSLVNPGWSSYSDCNDKCGVGKQYDGTCTEGTYTSNGRASAAAACAAPTAATPTTPPASAGTAYIGCKDGQLVYANTSQTACTAAVAPSGVCGTMTLTAAQVQALTSSDMVASMLADEARRQCATATQAPASATTTPAATSSATTAALSGRVTLPNPLGTTSPEELIGRVIKALLSIVGSLALLMFIYGGILWLTAGGSSEGVKKGQEIIKWSVAGILLIFTAYIILRYVLGALQGTFTP